MTQFKAIERIPNLCCSKITAVTDMKYVLIYDHEAIEGQHIRLRNKQRMRKWHSIFGEDSPTWNVPLEDHVRGSRFKRLDVEGSFSILAQVGMFDVVAVNYLLKMKNVFSSSPKWVLISRAISSWTSTT